MNGSVNTPGLVCADAVRFLDGKNLQQKLDAVIAANLLDNSRWDVPNAIIDQRNGHITVNGKTVRGYNSGSSNEVYGIDRWKFNCICEITDEGLKLTNPSTTNEWWRGLTQVFESDLINTLIGSTLTFSVLYKSAGEGIEQRLAFYNYDTADALVNAFPSGTGEYSVQSLTFTVPESVRDHTCYITFSPNISHAGRAGYYSIAKAAKLELGDHQTLAHQDASGNWVLNDPPPNKALELLKCQRYQHVIRLDTQWSSVACNGHTEIASDRIKVLFTLPAEMRAAPAVSFSPGWYARMQNEQVVEISGLDWSGFNGGTYVDLTLIPETTIEADSLVTTLINKENANVSIIFDANL